VEQGDLRRVAVVAAALVTPVAAVASGLRGRSGLALILIVLSGVIADTILARRR
jgi:hypothetical protein